MFGVTNRMYSKYVFALPREVGVLRVLQHPLACSPRKNGGAGGAVLKNENFVTENK